MTGPLLPRPDESSEPFWRACGSGELRVQSCANCGRRRMPPRPMCPWCRSLDAEWPLMSGRGRIWSFVVAHPPLLEHYAAAAPYVVVVVELEDDPSIRFVGNLVVDASKGWKGLDVEATRASAIAIGDGVHVAFGPAVDGVVLPSWTRIAPATPTNIEAMLTDR